MTDRLRFPKTARLTRAPEFAKLKKEGTSFHGKYMVLSVLECGAPGEVARVGIITSRRVGCAVERNRVRRRLREIFRHARSRISSRFWLVLVARQHAAGASYAQIEKEWWRLAERSGILTPEGASPCSP